jgi:hypothetical protein
MSCRAGCASGTSSGWRAVYDSGCLRRAGTEIANANAAENDSSGRTDGWSPDTSACVGAVIGSIVAPRTLLPATSFARSEGFEPPTF